MMQQLAYDANGYPIALPAEARKWLVRKIRPKAPPQVLFRNGQRATLPIEAGITDLRYIINDQPGRYRLVALDDTDQPIDGLPEAYVEIEPEAPPAAFVAPPPTAAHADPVSTSRAALAQQPTELLLLETMRANTEMARAMIDRLPDILKSSAYLIQAADAAGMPRRRPVELDDFDDDFDTSDNAPPAEPRASSMIETFLKAALLGGGSGLGGFAKLLGAGDSPASATAATAATAATTATPTTATPAAPTTTTPTTSGTPEPRNARPVDTQAHLLGVLAQLTADERAYAERVFAQLSPAAVQQWHELLLSMSVDEAVAMIRAKAKGEET